MLDKKKVALILSIAIVLTLFSVGLLIYSIHNYLRVAKEYDESISISNDLTENDTTVQEQDSFLEMDTSLLMNPKRIPSNWLDESTEPETEPPEDTAMPESTTPPLEGKALYESYVDDICSTLYSNVPASIIKALVYTESKWDPMAGSEYGYHLGLMQISPKWHKARMERLGVTDLLDPYGNLLVGIDLLSELINNYGSYACALMIFNGGYTTGHGLDLYRTGVISNYARSILESAGLPVR